jgi:hypothetical protein
MTGKIIACLLMVLRSREMIEELWAAALAVFESSEWSEV